MTSRCCLLGHFRQLLGFVLIGLLLQSEVASADGGGPLVNDYRKTYITTGSFADVRDLLDLAITDRGIVNVMKQEQAAFQCKQCGFKSNTLYWLCPSCHNWASVKPFASDSAC